MTASVEQVENTLASYEALALATGDRVEASPTEFSNDGVSWAPFWASAEFVEFPIFARATVSRNDVKTVRYCAWHESLPDDFAWRELWKNKPMQLFGAYTLRDAYRRAFRDVIGDRRDNEESRSSKEASESASQLVEGKNFVALIAETVSVEDLKILHNRMKKDRQVTVELEQLLRERFKTLSETEQNSSNENEIVQKTDIEKQRTNLTPIQLAMQEALEKVLKR